ncbi:MAG TPA: ABC transporter permease [Segeticoccus sp.]|uniref:ABC transporter permease n=1 Tax=Segeticoccus sp. TaxID=2706531 RepID=UPI002D7E5157|nr:ABC transporter permease [Segeticoccus sp.]HET8599908.1 ABC transporter permease [Segeticoccus sp.]
MTKLLVRRILSGLVILFAVSILVFLTTKALPGDAAQAILGREATPARLAAVRSQLHLDQSPVMQYLAWLKGILTGQLGSSFATGESIASLITPRMMNSLVLMGISAAIATPVAIVLGTWSALRRDRAADHLTSMVTLVLASMPEFVVGILLVLLLSTGVFHLLPAVFVAKRPGPIWVDPSQLVLPTLTLVLAVGPYIVRMMRATMVEVLESQYVLQARLKGLPERVVLWRHAIPNAIGPVAQVIALQLAWLAGGVVIVEFLFRFPGIGFALVDAVNNRDILVVQDISLLIAAVYIVVNLAADVVALAANPRVRTAAR